MFRNQFYKGRNKMRTIAFDTETYMIVSNSTPPKLVCVTTYDPCEDTTTNEDKRRIYNAEDGAAVLKQYFADPEVHIAVHNATFDLNVLVHHDDTFLPLIAKAMREGRVHCTKIRELMLNAADNITRGQQHWAIKEVGGADISALAGCLYSYFQDSTVGIFENEAYCFDWDKIRKDKYDKGSWRTRYSELDSVAVKDYPVEAVEYALNDALECYFVFKKQEYRARNMSRRLDIPNVLAQSAHETSCEFILNHMAGVTGISIDLSELDSIEADLSVVVEDEAEKIMGQAQFKIGKQWDGKKLSKDTKVIQSMWKRAYELLGVNVMRDLAKYFTESTIKKVEEYNNSTAPEVTNPKIKGVKKNGTFKGEMKKPELTLITNSLLRGRLLDQIKFKLDEEENQELLLIATLLEAQDNLEGASKEKNTFVKALKQAAINDDKRLRYGMSGYQATGRTSSQKPNLQNLPRKSKIKGGVGVRGAIIPPVGGCFIQADYSNAELRSLSQQLEWEQGADVSAMAREYKKDAYFDPHLYAAWKLYAIQTGDNSLTYEEVKKGYKKEERMKKIKENRQLCKVLNFGLAGGLSYIRFVDYARGYGVNISLEQSKELCSMWLEVWDEMKVYFSSRKAAYKINKITGQSEYVHVNTEKHARVQTLPISGRSRYCDRYTVACNSSFQSLTADGAKMALKAVWYDCYFNTKSPLYGTCRPILFVHDEIVLECNTQDRDVTTACAYRLKSLMEKSMEKYATPDIPCIAEPCVTMAWVKDAESWELEDGNLAIYGLDTK